MKVEKRLRTWRGFLRTLNHIQQHHKDLLFRGHSDSRWNLDTTLERRGEPNKDVAEYYRLLVERVLTQQQSLTETQFDVRVRLDELTAELQDYDGFSRTLTFGRFPAYGYMAHTRHHGFPSPLLDWTRSAHIAAFFAFAPEAPKVRSRSIYVWAQAEMSAHSTDAPQLKRLGRYVSTHRRHVLQQCEYTVCATYNTAEKAWRFTPQESVLAREDGSIAQFNHRLWKFRLPSSQRGTVLAFLDSVNLNAYSLFGSEESLMETLAVREFDLRPR
jgi:FRG domain